jgi:hypothetical protein
MRKPFAEEVIATLRKGAKVSIRKIAKSKGYSQAVADHPKQIVETDSYQSVMQPFVKKMEKERDRLIKALSIKNLDTEKYRDLIDGLDKLTKNIQLLSGGRTANDDLHITWEQ